MTLAHPKVNNTRQQSPSGPDISSSKRAGSTGWWMGARNAHLCPPVRATAGTATVCCRLEGRGSQDNDLMRLNLGKKQTLWLKNSARWLHKPAGKSRTYTRWISNIYGSNICFTPFEEAVVEHSIVVYGMWDNCLENEIFCFFDRPEIYYVDSKLA